MEDLVCRYGGEEFAVMLPLTDESGTEIVGEKLRSMVERHSQLIWNGYQLPKVTISVGGMALVPKYKTPPLSLFKAVDKAMYMSKQKGRNIVTTIEPPDNLLDVKSFPHLDPPFLDINIPQGEPDPYYYRKLASINPQTPTPESIIPRKASEMPLAPIPAGKRVKAKPFKSIKKKTAYKKGKKKKHEASAAKRSDTTKNDGS